MTATGAARREADRSPLPQPENAVPVFVRSLRKCADFCYSVFTVWSNMSDMSILKTASFAAIYAAIGE